jgi:signal transduction histidine kinase
MMSHELRTPLSVILGFGSILHDGLAGPVNAEQQEHLDRVLCNGRHLNQLIDDMLFFVDAETTRIAPQESPVDLPQLVHEVVRSLPEIGRPDAPSFSVTVAPDAAVLRTDPALLRVLFHLLGNAFKFTEHGGVCVDVRRAADAASTEIRITDTGVGIAPEKLRLIFDLFQQGDDTHARKRDGIGLGLNLVQACLALLHGRCALIGAPAGGTQVDLVIPDVRADRADGVRELRPSLASVTPDRSALLAAGRR